MHSCMAVLIYAFFAYVCYLRVGSCTERQKKRSLSFTCMVYIFSVNNSLKHVECLTYVE